jgi:hypothetical protein
VSQGYTAQDKTAQHSRFTKYKSNTVIRLIRLYGLYRLTAGGWWRWAAVSWGPASFRNYAVANAIAFGGSREGGQ